LKRIKTTEFFVLYKCVELYTNHLLVAIAVQTYSLKRSFTKRLYNLHYIPVYRSKLILS